jgi:hypothetical protein
MQFLGRVQGEYLVPEGRLNPFSAVPAGLTHCCDLYPGLRPGLLSGRPSGAGFAKFNFHADLTLSLGAVVWLPHSAG